MTQIANVMRLVSKDPKVEDGATIFFYTDREAATVSRVSKSGKTAWIRQDIAKRIDKNGASECQEYAYMPSDAPEMRVSKCKNGEWRTWGVCGGHKVVFGIRDKYHDFSF